MSEPSLVPITSDAGVEDGATYRYRVSLRLNHLSDDPDLYSSTLGLIPDVADRAGRPKFRKGKEVGVAKQTYWLHEFVAPDEMVRDVEDFLLDILETLNQHSEFFADLSSRGGSAELFIGFFMECFNTGFILSPGLLRASADLRISLSFDIYDSPRGDS